jgi:hypothetical protein
MGQSACQKGSNDGVSLSCNESNDPYLKGFQLPQDLIGDCPANEGIDSAIY